jgi:hypothetical protein
VLDASAEARYGPAASGDAGNSRSDHGAERRTSWQGRPRRDPLHHRRHNDEPRGKVDLVAILYIIGGIPALVGFLVVLFSLTHACGIPA